MAKLSGGAVDQGAAYEALRDRLVSSLSQLCDPETGAAIVARVSRREDLFEGPYLDDIPDILVELNSAYTGGSQLEGSLVTPMPMDELSAYSASHHPDGLFVFVGPGVQAGQMAGGRTDHGPVTDAEARAGRARGLVDGWPSAAGCIYCRRQAADNVCGLRRDAARE